MNAATGFASHPQARPELAGHAVTMALSRCGCEVASSIVLLLTPHFARQPQAAISAAARAGNCLQVFGCTTPGVFTEQAWTLDQPAAAALVLCSDLALTPPAADAPRLSLAMADALDAAWLRTAQPRFGALATGDEHHAVSAVWNHGKWQVEGRCETGLRGAQFELAVSRGMQALSGALEVGDVDGYELLLLGEAPPLQTLLERLPPELRDADDAPALGSGLFFAAVIDPALGLERSLAEGRYSLVPILSVNRGDGTVTLGAALEPGTMMFWALRHPLAAEMELRRGVMLQQERHAGQTPAFALLFSCLGRGPWFYGGTDHDLAVLSNRHPGLPVLGGYCGGEIAPLPGGNSILSYSAVAALAYADVQPDT